jgi:hypothetical protein
MPFRDPHAGDLATRIKAGVRQRIDEAVDIACLDILVNGRRSRGLPPPEAHRDEDRAEYTRVVRQLLGRLETQLMAPLDEPIRRRVALMGQAAGPDPIERLMAIQVALARELPDYWQRFDAVRTEYAAEQSASGCEQEASGGQSSGFFRRLFGRG